MTRTKFELVGAPSPAPLPTAAAPRRAGALATALLIFAALGAACWVTNRQLQRFLSDLDDQALGEAARTLEQLIARQREQLVSEVKVLADDNRIRATVLAPRFDEATVQDVLEDLRRSSGATLLGVLDGSGKVEAVTGAAGLKEVNLGASPAVKAAFDRPTSDVWTLPDQAQVIGLAPIRSGDQAPALLVKGLPLASSQLSTVQTALGVSGAVFIGDRIAASSSHDADVNEALRGALPLAEGTAEVAGGGRSFRVKVVRAGEGAMTARIAWLIPRRHALNDAGLLALLVWCPIPLGALLLLLLLVNSRRTQGGNA
ncbi:MAG TPA: hypothetical protein VKZ18_04660 [Polyangia bacterium]|nr:hypothetical protein [Polyangia bacterium]